MKPSKRPMPPFFFLSMGDPGTPGGLARGGAPFLGPLFKRKKISDRPLLLSVKKKKVFWPKGPKVSSGGGTGWVFAPYWGKKENYGLIKAPFHFRIVNAIPKGPPGSPPWVFAEKNSFSLWPKSEFKKWPFLGFFKKSTKNQKLKQIFPI